RQTNAVGQLPGSVLLPPSASVEFLATSDGAGTAGWGSDQLVRGHERDTVFAEFGDGVWLTSSGDAGNDPSQEMVIPPALDEAIEVEMARLGQGRSEG